MFWENTLRVSNACKGMLDYMWIESRIENTANGGVCLGLVTALGAAVHHPSLSDDWLTVVKNNSFGVVTAPTSVHHHRHGSAPP
jgi:hypothetical protein